MIKDLLERIVELVKEDPELHTALISLLKAKTAHENALAERALR